MEITRRGLLETAAAAAAAAAATTVGAPAFAQQKGGTLVIATSQVPRHLNPTVQSGIATGVPGTQIFASPLKFDANWNPQPYLAESWSVADDSLSVTLNLVKKAKFHDGVPITSTDVQFSIMTIKANHPFKSMFAPVIRVDTPDDHTAIIRLSHPHPALLLALSSALCVIIPKHVFDNGQDMKTNSANSKPVGSGPFELVEFKPGEQITLKRFDDFFIENRPYLDGIIIRTIRDPSAIVIAMENGDADMLPFMAAGQQIKRLSKSKHLNVTDKGYAGIGPINWLAFNNAKAPLDDRRVRQAIGYATDRDFITKALMRGYAKQQRSPIIETSPLFDPEIAPYNLNLEKANALLEAAGHKKGADGMRFTLTCDYIPGAAEQQKSVAEYLKSQLKKIGIKVDVRAAPDFPTWAGRVASHDFDMTMDIVFNWGDPVIGVNRTYLTDNIVKGVIWSNTQSYSNPKVDKLLNAAAIEMDPKKRKVLYDKFQIIVGEDLPIYWINALPYHTAYDKKIGNPPISIWGTMQSMDEVYMS